MAIINDTSKGLQVLNEHYAVHVAERGHPKADHVRALPQPIRVDEPRLRGVLDRGVGTADVVAGPFER